MLNQISKCQLRGLLFPHGKVALISADHFFYIPKLFPHTYDHSYWNLFFDEKKNVSMEICSGNGAWVTKKAQSAPNKNWIAIEKRFDRAHKIWKCAKRERIENLIVVCSEASLFLKYYVPESAVHDVFINFPDPWPKRKHFKNRLISTSFLHELLRVLKTEGSCFFVTDDVIYRDYTINLFKKETQFRSCFPQPFFAVDYPDYGTSFFELLWREKGRTIFYSEFKKELFQT